MQLTFESGNIIDNPTEEHLSQIDGEGFAVLGKEEGTYIQCAEQGEAPWEYVLEYQEQTLDEHYVAIGPVKLESIISAFKKYLLDDETWKTDFTWEKLDLG